MNDSFSPESSGSRPRRTSFRLRRLLLKELRETLRDRRTIVTLLLMPLLVYPALSLVFKTFLLNNALPLAGDQPLVLRIAFEGDRPAEEVRQGMTRLIQTMTQVERRAAADGADGSSPQELADFDDHVWIDVEATRAEARSKGDPEFSVEELVETEQADVGIRFQTREATGGQLGTAEILYRTDPVSQTASRYLRESFEQLNQFEMRQRLLAQGISADPALNLTDRLLGSEDEESGGPVPLASLIPLILVLMTITGAVYPAIDLTAGERERGTLETLMAAPVPRFGILFAKFLAVLTVALLTAVLNIGGMFATVWAFQLEQQLGGNVLSLAVFAQMLLLLVLFAAFFSAVLLVVTSFAKSFKEAQVYLIPIILLSLGPGLMAMAPGMELAGINTVTPMINILLLARDVISGTVQWVPALLAVASTLLYAYLAILGAARIFGSDAILYADSHSLLEALQRPQRASLVVPLPATLLCLALLLPINFASIGYLSRLPSETPLDLQYRFLMMGVFLFLSFVAVPLLMARHQRTDLATGFGARWPGPRWILAAVLLGVSLWPLVMYLTSTWHDVYGWLAGEASRDQWRESLVQATEEYAQRIRMVPPWVIAICFSVLPALCEEWFFRGMLLRSLLDPRRPWRAVILSAIIFGAFHMISNSVVAIDRLVPTTLVGVVLGYLAWRSGSVVPGMILHALHNAFVVFLAYYQPQLSQQAWFPGKDEPIPVSWVLGGAVLAALGVVLVATGRGNMQDIAAAAEKTGEAAPVDDPHSAPIDSAPL